MTVWELAQPTIERRGFLPMPTTRGDRLFIGLLGAAWIHLGWLMGTEQALVDRLDRGRGLVSRGDAVRLSRHRCEPPAGRSPPTRRQRRMLGGMTGRAET